MSIFLKANGLFTMCQSGFWEGDNTVYQLLHIYNICVSALDEKQSFGTTFLDLCKAFDRVWHKVLLARLYQYGFQGSLHSWLTNYLSDRQRWVVLNRQFSDWKTPTAGVPQGSILGPLMFIIYVNELPEIVNCAANIFADDTSIYAIGETLSEIRSTSKGQWQLSLNGSLNGLLKENLFISNNKSDICDNPIIMNQTELEVVKSHKYLGVIVSNDLKWTKHIDHIHAKSNKTLGMITAASHNMPHKCLDKAYSTVVRPTLEYAGPLLAELRAQDADHLESIQYQAGRLITGTMKFNP